MLANPAGQRVLANGGGNPAFQLQPIDATSSSPSDMFIPTQGPRKPSFLVNAMSSMTRRIKAPAVLINRKDWRPNAVSNMAYGAAANSNQTVMLISLIAGTAGRY